FRGSALRQELFGVRGGGTGVSTFDFKNITDNLARNHVVSNMPLFLFWAGIGVIVYFFAISIAGAFGRAVEMERELGYVNAPRQRIMRNAAIHTIVRLVMLGAWVVYMELFLRILLPYSLGAAHVAATSVLASAIAYAVLSTSILLASLHIHVVMLRLIFLRTRIFGSSIED
ncbi:MAG TPA: hypothetical protein VFI84_03590, partial [Candidatus Saccharimonadales bacterium]|nr:hypothetical protein [Candidatus Saccharimonadales bacterium]